jgi:hypothetical protein
MRPLSKKEGYDHRIPTTMARINRYGTINPTDMSKTESTKFTVAFYALKSPCGWQERRRDPEVGMCVEVLGDRLQSFLTLGECPLHQRLDDLAPFAGRHHLIEFEKHIGRDGE